MLSTAACSCVFMFISLKKIYDLSVALEEQDNLKQRMQLLKDQYVNQFAMDFVEFSWLVKKYTNSIITVSKQ